MIVAWTGHRPDLFRDAGAARDAVRTTARELVQDDATGFLVGGQRGVDTWAALEAMALGVPFRLVLPLELDEFMRDWDTGDRARLEQTLAAATAVRVAGGYTPRNRELATTANLLIAVWTRLGGGGTAETIDFARQAGTPVREVVLPAAAGAASAQGRGR